MVLSSLRDKFTLLSSESLCIFNFFLFPDSEWRDNENQRLQYVLFFQFRKGCNLCRAGRTSINASKIHLEFLIKKKNDFSD